MSANAFLSAIEDRRSLYQLAQSPISDERIHEIVAFAIRHTPSSMSNQPSHYLTTHPTRETMGHRLESGQGRDATHRPSSVRI